jgi:hypothetical protein
MPGTPTGPGRPRADALDALREVDFDWVTHIDSVWRDLPHDVPTLQAAVRDRIANTLESVGARTDDLSPQGLVLLGQGGAGKTHLLSDVRRQATARGHFFVLVDMTDVNDFWDTVLLAYIRSLWREGATTQPQLAALIDCLVSKYGGPTFRGLTASRIREQRLPRLLEISRVLRGALFNHHHHQALDHQHVVHAALLLSSVMPEVADAGYKWLQGVRIDEEEFREYRFAQHERRPRQIVQSLSWVMNLAAPTVLALDSLDAIVAEHRLAGAVQEGEEPAARQQASMAIIQNLAGGLRALRDTTNRTLAVVSCLEQTWHTLDGRVPQHPVAATMGDRSGPPLLLRPVDGSTAVRQLISGRLRPAYTAHGYAPPYSTFPFPESALEEFNGQTPREILKRCDAHRQRCLQLGAVEEFRSGAAAVTDGGRALNLQGLRDLFEVRKREAPVGELLAEEDDSRLHRMLETACYALVAEHEIPQDVAAQIDSDFGAECQPLHARIKLVFTREHDRESHYAFRFLEKRNARAFQARLKAAITAAGIDRDLGFRRLAIFRVSALPGGPMSMQLVTDLNRRAGLLLKPEPHELQCMWALSQMLRNDREDPHTRQWLRDDRPVSTLPVFGDAVRWLEAQLQCPPIGADHPTSPVSPPLTEPKVQGTDARPPASVRLRLGRRLVQGAPGDDISIPLENLTKHTVVLAGAGSGKTVFLRRIVEEAALLGIPSIIIDGANDLARLGDTWPKRPPEWTDEDEEKAKRYQESVEVVLWTPGRNGGNPLRLDPLPDFSAVADDPDELKSACDMARTNLAAIVAQGKGRQDKLKSGVLAHVLDAFVRSRSSGLAALVRILKDPPSIVRDDFEKGEKLSREMAELLVAEMKTNTLLGGQGAPLDPGMLLRSGAKGRVRVSVINLGGLPGQAAQQLMLDQLSMALFSWIKKNPARERPLQALLVIDEARDFVPSGKTVPGKDDLIRLVAQARKYGLGILFASQAPKSIDTNVVANCSTHVYGKANSPAAIETIQQALREKGTTGDDVAMLSRGTFYVYSDGFAAAAKVTTPLCLSHHPHSPPDEREIVERAVRSRELVTGRASGVRRGEKAR